MVNTRILDAEFGYLAPTALDEALDILNSKNKVKVLAGGTDLIVHIKVGAEVEMDYMLDIKRIEELDYVQLREHCCDLDEVCCIGANAKLSRIEKEAVIVERYPALAKALSLMASISVRNMGTMAGNICNASPVADSVIPAICYGARIKLKSADGERVLPLEDFFVAPGVSVIKPNELLTNIALPKPKPHTGASFIKKTRVRPDVAKISVGVVIERDGDKVANCRIAMGAIAATPAYLKSIGDSIVGKTMSEQLIKETAAAAARTIKPIDDNRTTAEYRTAIAEILTADALAEAWKNAGGEL
ncbi:MAG: FAD binding domain-containing protein [Bacillota bacterium]|nr:FAD binding domain-containing protein [Bacillota bacterium]